MHKVKTDNAVNILIEEHLFEKIRKAHTWYTSKLSYIFVFMFGVIDIAGFWQIATATISESEVSRFVIISALAVSFEFAPLYIGYALCLKCYNLGQRIHKWVLGLSTIACILGIVGNIYYRFSTIDIAYYDSANKVVSSSGLPITVLLCILPVITSLMNLTIGCLLFNPLEFDLLQLSKKLAKLKLYRQQVTAALEEFSDEETLRKHLEDAEMVCYNNVKQKINTMKITLNIYAIIKTSGVYEFQKKI